jgi:hypothetical protein
VEGVTVEVLAAALAAARQARQHILARMEACAPAPRRALADNAPRILRFAIDVDKIGLLIGPGGRTIRALTEAAGADEIQVGRGCKTLSHTLVHALPPRLPSAERQPLLVGRACKRLCPVPVGRTPAVGLVGLSLAAESIMAWCQPLDVTRTRC